MSQKGRRLLIGLVIALSVTGALILYLSGDDSNPEPINTGEVTIKGLVLENNKGCVVDTHCYLRIQHGDQETRVVYDYGEWPPCLNTEAGDQGFEMKKGDEVEVFGIYKEPELPSGNPYISTCDSPDYYIRKYG